MLPIALAVTIAVIGLIFGPLLYIRHVMKAHDEDRRDLPGTGGELARHLLDQAGLRNVRVESTEMGDHYDPGSRTVRLTSKHLLSRSITAVAVAAHEVSHAFQHAWNEPGFERRQRLVQAIIPLDRAAMVVLLLTPLIAIAVRSPGLVVAQLGIVLLLLAGHLVVHLATLSVEVDASFNKALPILEKGGYLSEADLPAARRVLRAAALTYVAGALISLINVLRVLRP
jgi:Zn-dependent membrane protease YugP